MLRTAQGSLLALFILSVSVALGLDISTRFAAQSKAVRFADFMRDVNAGRIEQVTIAGQRVTGAYRANQETFHTYSPAGLKDLTSKLNESGVLIRPG